MLSLCRPSLILLVSVFLTACTQFPSLDRTITPALEAAPYPELIAIEPVLARAKAPGVNRDVATTGLNARVSNLRARAARLRGSVLTGRERLRLERGMR